TTGTGRPGPARSSSWRWYSAARWRRGPPRAGSSGCTGSPARGPRRDGCRPADLSCDDHRRPGTAPLRRERPFMSRTAESLAILDRLIPVLEALPREGDTEKILEEADALRRAVAAFHMEAIRFRMYNVDRMLKLAGNPTEARTIFDELRQALERAGFHTRSHAAP